VSVLDNEVFYCYEYRNLWVVIIIIVISVFVILYSFLINSLEQHDLHVFKFLVAAHESRHPQTHIISKSLPN